MPHWLKWTAARWGRTLRTALGLVDVPAAVSAQKAADELGWRARSAKESVPDTAESLIDLGVVPAR